MTLTHVGHLTHINPDEFTHTLNAYLVDLHSKGYEVRNIHYSTCAGSFGSKNLFMTQTRWSALIEYVKSEKRLDRGPLA